MHIDFKIPNPPFIPYFTAEFCGADKLSEGEKVFIERAVEQRVKHFSTGRHCAKQALVQMGIIDCEILMDEGKAPVWPQGMVGSISHTKYLAGAVVGLSDKISAIGLDIETIGGIRDDLWDMLFLSYEQLFLNQLPEEEVAFYATLIFSAKEAFYKFQYPLTKTFLDFTDVEMYLVDNRFEIKVLKDFPGKEKLPIAVPVHYTTQGDQLITLCYMEK